MGARTDRIEKMIRLRAPRSRVWRALTDAREFGAWFQVELEGAFAPGARVRGKITTPGYEHLTMEITVERMEPERLFSYRWHPYAIDPKLDYSSEPTTLVEFQLAPVAEGGGIGIRSHSGGASGRGVSHERRGVGRADEEHRTTCRVGKLRAR